MRSINAHFIIELAQDKTDVVGSSAELACLSC